MLSAPNTQTLLLLCKLFGKHALSEECMPTCHSFETTCLLDRTTRRSIQAKNIFEVSGRGSQEDRSSTMPHRLKFECTAHSVITARCGHGHWTQAPLGSGANLIVELDASKKRKKKRVKRSNVLCFWPGSAKEAAGFFSSMWNTFPDSPSPDSVAKDVRAWDCYPLHRENTQGWADPYELEVHWNNRCALTVRQVTKRMNTTHKKMTERNRASKELRLLTSGRRNEEVDARCTASDTSDRFRSRATGCCTVRDAVDLPSQDRLG